MRWHVTMKNHFLWHICAEAARGISPRATMAHSGEDLVGQVANIAKGTTKSVSMVEFGGKVFEKYCVGMAARLRC